MSRPLNASSPRLRLATSTLGLGSLCLLALALLASAATARQPQLERNSVPENQAEASPVSAQEAAREAESPFLMDLRERPIGAITTDIEPASNQTPTNVAAERLAEIESVSRDEVLERLWMDVNYSWHAPAFAHRPLYFEQVNLERHGYGPRYLRVIQPALSGAHFFATIPALPYKMFVQPPHSCVYPLGHYRPGNCVPYRWHRLPLSPGAGAVEAGSWIGLVLLIP